MKRFIRIIAVLMALFTVCGILAACADPGSGANTTEDPASTVKPSGDTGEATLYEKDNLKDSYNFNETITIYMWKDYTMMEFYAEENGDVINDAIFARNQSVEERLGITFEFVEEAGSSEFYEAWIQKAENDFQSDNEFDIYAGYSRSAPLMALRNMTVNLLDYEAFSVEKPWWPAALTNECTINDKLYYCSGDISTNLLWMMIGTFYNKELYKQYFPGEKTPMDMVEDKEWTMEKMFTMCRDIYVDDGNGSKDMADTYGCVIYEVNIDAFQTAAGIVSIEKDEKNGIRISKGWNSETASDVCELVGNFLSSPGCLYNGKTSIRNVFFEERSLFIVDRTFIVAGKDTSETAKIEFSYGIVPQPMYTAQQEHYMTNVGHPFTMYAVNSQSKHREASVTTLEAMGSANHRTVTPAVFEVAMKVRYTDDPQTANMYDILRENISFDIGRLYASTFGNGTANLFRTAAKSSPAGLLTLIKRNVNIIEKGIDKIMDFYGE
ncbi:MAG: hypothetical protein ACI3XI_08435 [Eubacteriales bacterium]